MATINVNNVRLFAQENPALQALLLPNRTNLAFCAASALAIRLYMRNSSPKPATELCFVRSMERLFRDGLRRGTVFTCDLNCPPQRWGAFPPRGPGALAGPAGEAGDASVSKVNARPRRKTARPRAGPPARTQSGRENWNRRRRPDQGTFGVARHPAHSARRRRPLLLSGLSDS